MTKSFPACLVFLIATEYIGLCCCIALVNPGVFLLEADVPFKEQISQEIGTKPDPSNMWKPSEESDEEGYENGIPHLRYGKEAAPHLRYGKELEDFFRYGKESDDAQHVRYGKEADQHVRYGKMAERPRSLWKGNATCKVWKRGTAC